MGNTGIQHSPQGHATLPEMFVHAQHSLTFEDMHEVRKKIANFLAVKSLPSKTVDDINLAVTEILSNLVKHPKVALSYLTVRIQIDKKRISVDIADNCPTFIEFETKCRNAKNPEHTLALGGEGGYGLSLIMEVTSALQYIPSDASDDQLNHFITKYDIYKMPEKKKTLFLVDDDPIALAIHQKMLEDQYNVICFEEAQQALEAFAKDQPDIIVSDLMMPGMNGTELRQELSRIKGGDTTPFVFLSGNTKEQNSTYISSLGIDDFLCKPIKQEKLHTVLQRLLKRSDQIQHTVHEEFNDNLTDLLKPSVPANFKNWHFHLEHEVAEAGGGDFTLHQETKNKNLALALADVMGHGKKAKFFAYMYAGYLRSIFRVKDDFSDPSEFLEFVSHAVGNDDLLESIILTCQCFLIFPDGTINIASAGHPPPILIRKQSSQAEAVPVAGPLLGLAGDNSYELATLKLEPGDRLLILTDGFLDAFDEDQDGQETEKLITTINENITNDVVAFSNNLWTEFKKRRDEKQLHKDDVTTIIMEYGGPQ